MKKLIISGIALTIAIMMAGTVLATQERPHTVDNGGITAISTPTYNYTYIDTNRRIDAPTGLTDDEIEELTRVIYLEAGAESDLLIRYCTDVAFNQLRSGLFGNSMHEVLHWPSNYTETVPYIWTKEPTQRVRDIVMDVYLNGTTLPERIIFYRNEHFHTFEAAVSEFSLGNVFFSSSRYYQ